MSVMDSKSIILGSGSLYYYPMNENTWANYANGNITDATIENNSYRLGLVSGGYTVTYEPTFVKVKDDLGLVQYTGLQEENIAVKSGLLTFDSNTLNALASTGSVTTVNNITTFDLGGISHYNQADALLRFVSSDNKKRADIKPELNGGFELSFQKDNATVLDVMFQAAPMPGLDGRMLKYSVQNV